MPEVVGRLERAAKSVRHHPVLARLDVLWDGVRPGYESVLTVLGRSGIPRTINGTDRILVSPDARGVPELYEPDVWARAMGAVESGDTVVDVGAFVGLYTVAFAKRTGPSGRVVAFEPDPRNFDLLARHVDLNDVAAQVELHRLAVTDSDGRVPYDASGGSEARVNRSSEPRLMTVQGIALDTAMAGRKVDVLKIDVEGHEDHVLQGALTLLSDGTTAPRIIFVEVHPYAWSSPESGAKLLRLLNEAGYMVTDVTGHRLDRIGEYGEVIATRPPTRDLNTAPMTNGALAVEDR